MAPFLFLASLAATLANPCHGDAVVSRSAYAMGTLLRVEIAGLERSCGLAASEAVLAEVARLEAVLSSWSEVSEVGRLNAAAAGVAHPLSPELAGLLDEATSWTDATGGAFDPGVGALLSAWDMRGPGRVPAAGEVARALESSGLRRLVRADGAAVRPDSVWWLDTGGFGKGAALRAAAAVLRAHGVEDALLDFGGQLLVLGEAREVVLADPRERELAMPQRLRVAGASVSTTSSSERFVSVAGARYGHVLDPRSGHPVAAWGSVSVIAADPLAADALSTALFVLGPAAALAWGEAHPEFGVVVQRVVAGDVVVSASAGARRFLLPSTDITRGASLP